MQELSGGRCVSLAKEGPSDGERAHGPACCGGGGSGARLVGRHMGSTAAEGQQGSLAMGWGGMGWDGVGWDAMRGGCSRWECPEAWSKVTCSAGVCTRAGP